jgi:hypothetical protein
MLLQVARDRPFDLVRPRQQVDRKVDRRAGRLRDHRLRHQIGRRPIGAALRAAEITGPRLAGVPHRADLDAGAGQRARLGQRQAAPRLMAVMADREVNPLLLHCDCIPGQFKRSFHAGQHIHVISINL